jgi:hypothetical protein
MGNEPEVAALLENREKKCGFTARLDSITFPFSV